MIKRVLLLLSALLLLLLLLLLCWRWPTTLLALATIAFFTTGVAMLAYSWQYLRRQETGEETWEENP